MALQLEGLWTIQDFWIGHHNLLLRRVDGDTKGNMDLRFEGTVLFIGNTAIADPLVSIVDPVDVPAWVRETYAHEVMGNTVFHLSSKLSVGSTYIVACTLWRQTNSLPKHASSLRGKYEGPRTIGELAEMIQTLTAEQRPGRDPESPWERVVL